MAISPIFEQLISMVTDCSKCHRMKRNLISFFALVTVAVAVGAWTGIVFSVIGAQFFSLERLEYYIKLPMIAGTTFFLWWALWQDEKIACNC